MTSSSSIPEKPILPTLDRLNVSLAPDLDALKVASEWFQAFSSRLEAADVDGILSLLVHDAFWRDILSLTWDFRTFYGEPTIAKFLRDRLAGAKMKEFKLESAKLLQPYPDVAWIQGLFLFEIGGVGAGDGVFRLVPNANGEWKGHTIFTSLKSLDGHPEKVGPYRNPLPNRGKWVEQRRRELEFEDAEPYVIVIGGGQSGLSIAARLKFLDVPTLVLEKSDRIGSQWRGRYEALCLHDPVWYDHMAYIPFPDSWPVWTPAQKLADWLESYAHSLEINVWLSSPATSVRQDPVTKQWTVVVRRGDTGKERVFHPAHVVLALGLAGGVVNIPELPGQELFEGKILHSTQHKTARDNIGKKVVVLGAATSGHDVAFDHAEYGVDVTMYQRSPTYIMSTKEGFPRVLHPYVQGGPPTDVADRIFTSFPLRFLSLICQRETKAIAEADKVMLDGLTKKGFKIHFGDDGSGFMLLVFSRGGGYYLDAGASQMIIDGKIKLKNDSEVECYTKKGLKFKDGSELEADVVVFANGFGDTREAIQAICGPEITEKVKPIWGMDEEGEPRSAWKDCGVENMWYMMGNLAMARYHSLHLALQIKAMKEGMFGGRYDSA